MGGQQYNVVELCPRSPNNLFVPTPWTTHCILLLQWRRGTTTR